MFDRRLRGFRIVELGAAFVLLVLVVVVYLAKTGASGKGEDIDHVQAEIAAERTQIRLLNAELAHQEQPERLEALSTRYLGLQPIDARHDIKPERLAEIGAIAAKPSPAPAPATTPAAGEAR